MNDFEKLIRKINKYRNDRDWKQFHVPKDLALSLSLEASEVLEHFQWKSEEIFNKYIKSKANKEALAGEIADVLYWVLLLSHDLDIDIMKAFEKKMKENSKKYPIKKAKGTSLKYTNL